jgi:hypothetical protein
VRIKRSTAFSHSLALKADSDRRLCKSDKGLFQTHAVQQFPANYSLLIMRRWEVTARR